MQVAVTGASGFLGSVMVRHLKQAGHSIVAHVRETSRREHIEQFVDRFAVGDHSDENMWPDLLEGTDCVVHNSFDWQLLRRKKLKEHLSCNLSGSIRLIEEAAPRQFIFISTIAVHHEILPRWNGIVDEDHPLRPGSLYGAYKAAIEAHLFAAHTQHDMHVSAIRPCAVYGIDPNMSRSIGYPVVRTIKSGKPYHKQGGGKFVHVDDVATTVAAIVGNEVANGCVYNLADCYCRWSDWAQMIADILGVEADIDFSSPAESKNVFSKQAVQSLGVDMSRGYDGIRDYLKELIDVMI